MHILDDEPAPWHWQPTLAEAEWMAVLGALPRVVNSLPEAVRAGLAVTPNADLPSPDPAWEADTLRALAWLKAKGTPPPFGQDKDDVDAWLLQLAATAIDLPPPDPPGPSVEDAATILSVTPPGVAAQVWWAVFRERPMLLATGMGPDEKSEWPPLPSDGPAEAPPGSPAERWRLLHLECCRARVGLAPYLATLRKRWLQGESTMLTPAAYGLERAKAAARKAQPK